VVCNVRAQRVQNFAYGLIRVGIRPGDRIAVLSPNSYVHPSFSKVSA